MSLVGRVMGSLLRPLLERQARGRSWTDLITSLEEAGAKLETRFEALADTPHNHELAQHIIGIERWGQRRLRVAQGEPFVLDGHGPYRPTASTLSELRTAFADTRQKTVELAQELEATGVDPELRVRHNDFGELTLRGWLTYLDKHAQREAGLMKD